MKITKNKFYEYCSATGFRKSYEINDYKKCKILDINEFIFISDHFDEINQKYKTNLINNKKVKN